MPRAIREHDMYRKSYTWTLYRIYDTSGEIVYIGQTCQELNFRIKQHFNSNGKLYEYRHSITLIEYAELKTAADLNLYEIYYIGKFHPIYNKEFITRDNPTIELPELNWMIYKL